MQTTPIKITMSLIEDQVSHFHSVEISLGSGCTMSINDSGAHFYEELQDGVIDVGMPGDDKIIGLFRRYNLTQITKRANPEIFAVLRKVFLMDDKRGFSPKPLESRKTTIQAGTTRQKKVKISKDRNILGLLSDLEFQKLAEISPSTQQQRKFHPKSKTKSKHQKPR